MTQPLPSCVMTENQKQGRFRHCSYCTSLARQGTSSVATLLFSYEEDPLHLRHDDKQNELQFDLAPSVDRLLLRCAPAISTKASLLSTQESTTKRQISNIFRCCLQSGTQKDIFHAPWSAVRPSNVGCAAMPPWWRLEKAKRERSHIFAKTLQ